MEFTFLGTSAGTPTRSRNVSGLALCHSGPKPWYLVDCGEGTQDVADRVGPWPQHSSAEQVARFAQQAHLPHLGLTHFSSRYQSGPGGTPHINQLAAEAMQHYRGQLFLARDFDTYRLEKDLSLNCLISRRQASPDCSVD